MLGMVETTSHLVRHFLPLRPIFSGSALLVRYALSLTASTTTFEAACNV